MGCLSVQSAVVIAPPVTVILQYVQHSGHLTEDQDSRICQAHTNVDREAYRNFFILSSKFLLYKVTTGSLKCISLPSNATKLIY